MSSQPKTLITPQIGASRTNTRESFLAYAFILPAAIPLLLFSLYPIAAVFFGSFFKDVDTQTPHFVGLANFDAVLGGREFWHSLLVTVYYVLGVAPVAIILSFLIATLLHQNILARGMYRTAFFLPYVTSTVAAASIFRWIFGISQRSVANIVFNWFGLPQQGWVQEPRGIFELIANHFGATEFPLWAAGPSLALCCVIVFSIWHMLGFNIVVFLAGISAISRDVYEAADVDGANWWQKTRYITLPLLSPTMFFLLIISVIRSFQSFNDIYILTPVERTNSTQNLVLLIVSKMREGGDYGFALAVSFILFLIIMGLTLAQVRLFERQVHYQ